MEDGYTSFDLEADLWRMVQVGLLDAHIRDDGEWVYKPSAKTLGMNEQEILELIHKCGELEYPFSE